MKGSASKIQLAGFDDLFQTSSEAEANGEQVREVPLTELFPFKDHPFQVRDDEAMQKTVASIARSGVLSPGIVRPRKEGGYEIIAGHRRKRGSELAGKTTMPVLIRTLDDDEATIIMVDSNLQREKILPSEKAFAYKMKLEALKHQGKRRDLTSEPAVPKLTAREKIAQDAGESCGLTVTRYIALTKLIPPRGCAGSFQASTAASILPTILHHPADGGSNRVPAGNVERSAQIEGRLLSWQIYKRRLRRRSS